MTEVRAKNQDVIAKKVKHPNNRLPLLVCTRNDIILVLIFFLCSLSLFSQENIATPQDHIWSGPELFVAESALLGRATFHVCDTLPPEKQHI